MKSVTKMFVVATLLAAQTGLTSGINLEQALQQKKVLFSAKGKAGAANSHYGKCLQMTLKNQTPHPLNVSLEVGRLLVPKDSNVQNMLVTKPIDFVLLPGKELTQDVYAMCAQRHDGSPSSSSDFSSGRMGNDKLQKIARFIDKYHLHNAAGQAAVWSVSDRKPVWEISMSDTAMQNKLRNFVASVTGLPIKPPFSREISSLQAIHSEEYTDAAVYKTTCSFEYSLVSASSVSLNVYNRDNRLVKEVLRNQPMVAGKTTTNVILSTRELPAGIYRLVLSIGNEQTITQNVVLGRELLDAQEE